MKETPKKKYSRLSINSLVGISPNAQKRATAKAAPAKQNGLCRRADLAHVYDVEYDLSPPTR
jgi:hypothetical protein